MAAGKQPSRSARCELSAVTAQLPTAFLKYRVPNHTLQSNNCVKHLYVHQAACRPGLPWRHGRARPAWRAWPSLLAMHPSRHALYNVLQLTV